MLLPLEQTNVLPLVENVTFDLPLSLLNPTALPLHNFGHRPRSVPTVLARTLHLAVLPLTGPLVTLVILRSRPHPMNLRAVAPLPSGTELSRPRSRANPPGAPKTPSRGRSIRKSINKNPSRLMLRAGILSRPADYLPLPA